MIHPDSCPDFFNSIFLLLLFFWSGLLAAFQKTVRVDVRGFERTAQRSASEDMAVHPAEQILSHCVDIDVERGVERVDREEIGPFGRHERMPGSLVAVFPVRHALDRSGLLVDDSRRDVPLDYVACGEIPDDPVRIVLLFLLAHFFHRHREGLGSVRQPVDVEFGRNVLAVRRAADGQIKPLFEIGTRDDHVVGIGNLIDGLGHKARKTYVLHKNLSGRKLD